MDESTYPTLEEVIVRYGIPHTRILRALQREGIKTTEELLKFKASRLRVMREIGPVNIQIIENGLATHNLKLVEESQ